MISTLSFGWLVKALHFERAISGLPERFVARTEFVDERDNIVHLLFRPERQRIDAVQLRRLEETIEVIERVTVLLQHDLVKEKTPPGSGSSRFKDASRFEIFG